MAPAKAERRRSLPLWGLVAYLFCSVSGGPFGSEAVVAAAGPLLGLLGFALLPLVWSIPEALVTAELASAFPQNAGFVIWVTAAFGPTWGFVEGFLSWVLTVTDSAIYPVVFCDYLKHVLPATASGVARRACIVSFSVALTALNFLGIKVSGWFTFALCVFTMLPFLYIVPAGLSQAQGSNFLEVPPWEEIQWKDYLFVLFWSLNYWDSASNFAAEVERPGRTFPLGLAITIVVVLATYLLPMSAGIGLPGNDWKNWTDGTFVLLGGRLGGDVVKVWVVMASAASSFGQYLSDQAAATYQLEGMAALGWLPQCLTQRSRRGTPALSLLLCLAVSLTFSFFDFLYVVDLVSAVYCEAQLLEFAAFVKLRHSCPELHRPYRVPLPGTHACAAMLLPAFLLALLLLSFPVMEKDWMQVAFLIALPFMGLLLHKLLEAAKRSGWVDASRFPPQNLAELIALGAAASGDDPCLGDSSSEDETTSNESSEGGL